MTGGEGMGWLRRPPTSPAGAELKALFRKVVADPRFHRVAGLSPTEVEFFRHLLDSALLRYSTIIQGGYVGPVDGRLVLALSRWHRRLAPAAHELFHLAREVRGLKSLRDPSGVWREECMVWFQTIRYVSLRGTVELVIPLTIAGAFAWGVSRVWARLLGVN